MPSVVSVDTTVKSVVRGAGSGASAPSIDLPAPTSFWSMNGSAGANETDTVGGLVLTTTGSSGSAAGAGSGTGTSRSFVAASSQYLTTPDSAPVRLNTTATVAFWAYLNDKTTFRYFFYKGTGNTTLSQDVGCYFSSTNNRIECNFNDTGGNNFLVNILPNPSVSTWYCLGFKWDSAQLYASLNGAAWTPVTAASLPANFGGPFQIGARNVVSGLYMDGRIDAFGIWKGASLTNAQIANFYNGGLGREFAGGAWQ